MSKDPHIANIFSAEHEPCLSLEEMNAFLAQQLEGAEKHRVERHLLNCELCGIAVESLEENGADAIEAGAEAVAGLAWERAAAQNKKKRRGAIFWISAAASVAILVTIGAMLNQGPTDLEYEKVFTEGIRETTPPLPKEEITSASEPSEDLEDPNGTSRGSLDGKISSESQSLRWANGSSESEKLIETLTLSEAKGDAKGKRGDGLAAPAAEQSPKAPAMRSKDAFKAMDNDFAAEEMEAEDDAFADAESMNKFEFATSTTSKNANTVGNTVMDSIATTDMLSGKSFATNSSPNYTQNQMASKEISPVLADAKRMEKQKVAKPQAGGKATSAAKDDSYFRTRDAQEERAVALDEIATAPSTTSANNIEQKVNEMDEGLLSYREGRFAEAAEHLRKATEATPGNLQAHLLAADAYLRIKQPQAALYHAGRVLSQPGNSYFEDAEWYKALALIGLKEGKKAKPLLLKIKEGKGKYAEKAAKALETLD